MKIIAKDNFDKEQVSDELICENVTEANGQMIVDALNETQETSKFYELVPDNYKLYIYNPNE